MPYRPVNSSLGAARSPNGPLLFSAEDGDPRRSLQFLFRSSILGAVEGDQKDRKSAVSYETMGKNSLAGHCI